MAQQPQQQQQNPNQPPSPMVRSWGLFQSFWVANGIHAAVRLKIPHALSKGPLTTTQLAESLGVNEGFLYRLMRALHGENVFSLTEDGKWENNSMSTFLVESGDIYGHLIGQIGESWRNMDLGVRTGMPVFPQIQKKGLWEFLKDPEEAKIFNNTMTQFSSLFLPSVAQKYDWSKFSTVMDVGGGAGHLVHHLLKVHGGVKGIVFDLPDVIETAAKPMLQKSPETASRVSLQSGSFFDSVPKGADAIVMKHIIHDWGDEESTVILKNCHKSLAGNPKGRVFLVEFLVPELKEVREKPTQPLWMDINMMVLVTGKERTREEFRRLFEQGGFKLGEVVPVEGSLVMLEAIPF